MFLKVTLLLLLYSAYNFRTVWNVGLKKLHLHTASAWDGKRKIKEEKEEELITE